MKELDLIIKNIKNNALSPLYFFHGEEPYYIDLAIKSFENDVLQEDEKAFNQIVVYGKDTNYFDVLASARQVPMMGDKMLIIVKEAQDLKMGSEENEKGKKSETEALIEYIENPVESTILVFAHKNKKLDGKKRKLNDLLKKKNYIFLSEKIRDYELPKFIESELKNQNIKTSPNIPNLLAEHLGNDLSRISNELNKLKLILQNGEILDEKLVEKHIGISKDFNVFELQKALGQKNAAKAMKIVYYMGKNPKTSPIVMTIANLYNFFSNIIIYHTMSGQPQQAMASEMGINPYFVKDYAEAAKLYPLKHATRTISILRETDMKSKGLGANQTEESELLKEMVYKILNVDKVLFKV
ncbi:MAG: DNA polymerase III subunit delta [Flavobacteriaceae bacterium]|jgi:DNA polymerase-3 subunit delta|nr:DNA polymerase III subunit delta [Flavobacteriaceae bacterium]